MSEHDPPTQDHGALMRAALSVRDAVEANGGTLVQGADELFAAFGFTPTSYAEQQEIERVLRRAGLNVEPLDNPGRTVKLSLPTEVSSEQPTRVWASAAPASSGREELPLSARRDLEGRRLLPVRNVVLLVLLTGIMCGAVSFAVAALALDRGPSGARGAQGRVGPQGPPGDTNVSSSDVVSAVEDDPEAIAQALSGNLDYDDIQQHLDPDPADVKSSVDDLSSSVDDLDSKLGGLCNDLQFSDAVSADVTSC